MLNDQIIKALEDVGFTRRVKNGLDQMYLDHWVSEEPSEVSIDIATGEIVSNNQEWADYARQIVADLYRQIKEDEAIEAEDRDNYDSKTRDVLKVIPESLDPELQQRIDQMAVEIREEGLFIPYGPDPYKCSHNSICAAEWEIAKEMARTYRDVERGRQPNDFIFFAAKLIVIREIRAERFGG